jgi:DNA-binding PadR family transcriptional regulator
MIKYALLGLLARHPMHGYELKEKFSLEIGNHWSLNFGQIYTTLERLHRDGLVRHSLVKESGGPDKKVYSLTVKGHNELNRWFLTPISSSKRLKNEFYIKLILSLTVGSVDTLEVIQTQRRNLLEEMHQLACLKSKADPIVQLPWILLLDSAALHCEADLRWLDMCEGRLDKVKKAKLEFLQTYSHPKNKRNKREKTYQRRNNDYPRS